MTNLKEGEKLFHTTNDETLLSGIYFSPEFQQMRDRGTKKWEPNEKALKGIKAIEQSISVKKGFTTQNTDNGQ